MNSLARFIKSFYYAGKGVIGVVAAERNMRIHLLAAATVIALGFYFRITATEWCLVAICIGTVMAAEAFNSAIEWLTDLVKPEHHPLAEKVKDAAAGGVLLASVAAAAVGCIVFLKHLIS